MAAATLNPQRKPKAPAKPMGAPRPAPPVPMAGETQSQFYLRAMRALQKPIPSINARTREVLRIWCESDNAADLRSKAESRFPTETFVHYGPRCVFLEHTVPAGADGSREQIVYNQKALQQLVDWANYRIANSDNFSAISDGHTPSQAERAAGSPMPDVLGYAGPFYLGQFGDLDPRWAIYADEWVHKDDHKRFSKLQRRSPEVWVDEPLERRTMDPIAALGAETPRLDSGMNAYARAGDDRNVMRYSAVTSAVAAFPGPTNSFTPTGERRKQRYGDSPMPFPNDAGSADANAGGDLAEKVGAAIQGLIPSLVEAVVAQISGGGDVPDENTDATQDDEPLTPRGADDSGEADTPAAPTAPAAPAADSEDTSDPEAAKYKAMGPQCYEAYRAGRASAAKYSRSSAPAPAGLAIVVARQADRIKALETSMERERRDLARYSKLHELSQEYAFDPREEADTCLDMTDKQFERHCTATIIKYSRRGDVTGLDLYDDPEVEPDRYARSGANASRVKPEQIERYSREAAAIAARKNAAKRGSTTFEAEFDAICKQHGVAI